MNYTRRARPQLKLLEPWDLTDRIISPPPPRRARGRRCVGVRADGRFSSRSARGRRRIIIIFSRNKRHCMRASIMIARVVIILFHGFVEKRDVLRRAHTWERWGFPSRRRERVYNIYMGVEWKENIIHEGPKERTFFQPLLDVWGACLPALGEWKRFYWPERHKKSGNTGGSALHKIELSSVLGAQCFGSERGGGPVRSLSPASHCCAPKLNLSELTHRALHRILGRTW